MPEPREVIHMQQQQNYATPEGNLDGLCVKNPAPQSRAERGDNKCQNQ